MGSLITPGQSCSERFTTQVVSDRARVKTQAVWFRNSWPKLTHLPAQSLQSCSTLCDPMDLWPSRLLCPAAWTILPPSSTEWTDEWRKKERRFMKGRKSGKTQRKNIGMRLIQPWGLFIFFNLLLKQFLNFYWFLKCLAMPCGMWNHSFLAGDRTPAPCIRSTES